MGSAAGTPTNQIAKDSILEGPYWPELVRVLSAQVRNRRIEIHAVGTRTERYFSDLLDAAEFEANVRVTPHEAVPTFSANPKHFRLAIEAQRIRLASSLRAIRKSLGNRRNRLQEIQRLGRLLLEEPREIQEEDLSGPMT